MHRATGRERHCIFEIIDHGQRVIYRDLCVMRTVQDASAAVNAEFIYNMRLSVMYPDRLGRAVLDTVDTALAGGFFQADRTHKFIFIQITDSFLYILDPLAEGAAARIPGVTDTPS